MSDTSTDTILRLYRLLTPNQKRVADAIIHLVLDGPEDAETLAAMPPEIVAEARENLRKYQTRTDLEPSR